MNRKIQLTTLLIALAQGAHSIEEAKGKLWDVYPPATWLCSLVSSDLKTGFIVINVGLFIILVLTWLSSYSKTTLVTGLLWIWVVLETINGIGHMAWAIIERSYVPGLLTAPLLLFLALWLGIQLTQTTKRNRNVE